MDPDGALLMASAGPLVQLVLDYFDEEQCT